MGGVLDISQFVRSGKLPETDAPTVPSQAPQKTSTCGAASGVYPTGLAQPLPSEIGAEKLVTVQAKQLTIVAPQVAIGS